MKHGNSGGLDSSSLGVDLDALERDIQKAAATKRTGSNDPLAELARIMGQDDPFAGLDKARSMARPQILQNETAKAPSFDEFLNARDADSTSDTPSSGKESVFDAFLDQPSFKSPPGVEPSVRQQESELSARMDADEEDDSLFQDDQEISDPEPDRASLQIPPHASQDAFNDFDDMIAGLPPREPIRADMVPDTLSSLAPAPAVVPPQFDDMLAEFESAMRDAGGERLATSAPPSLAPIVIPPPPEDMLLRAATPERSDSGYMASGLSDTALAGAAAGGAAVIAASAASYGHEHQAKRPRRGLMIAGGVIGVAIIGISVLLASGSGTKKPTGGQAPVIAANSAVIKERPANPGGVEVPNQDKEVLKTPTTSSSSVDRMAPREEQPLDLKQAQATAATQPAVRQIPGVVIIPPAGSALPSTPSGASTPAVSTGSPSVAGNQPVARPVASVPISIAGQPIVTVPTPPVVAAPTSVSPVVPEPVASAAAPKVIPPVASLPTAAQSTVAQPSAPAEPRKVRAVPIRPESENSPSRAQAQARVVPAAPRPAPVQEAASGSGPMRITPQALRGTQRVASASSPDQPATSSVVAPVAASAGGSGFSVQLGAEGTQDAARAKFNRVKGQHIGVLASQSANIRNAEVNGRTVYRIRVGSMSRAEAVSLCERLKADGGSCFVARN